MAIGDITLSVPRSAAVVRCRRIIFEWADDGTLREVTALFVDEVGRSMTVVAKDDEKTRGLVYAAGEFVSNEVLRANMATRAHTAFLATGRKGLVQRLIADGAVSLAGTVA